MRTVLFLVLSMLCTACVHEQRPAYGVIENTLPDGGPTIAYETDSSLTNIDEIDRFLNDEDSRKFDDSLSWYGTESSFGLDRIDGKTARQLVDTVNCLKTSSEEKQAGCFD